MKKYKGLLMVVLMASVIVFFGKNADAKSKECIVKKGVLIEYSGNAHTFKVPNEVTAIKYDAFRDAKHLTKLVISKNVKKINPATFSFAKKLKTITVSKKNKKYSSYKGLLYNKSGKKLCACPNAKKNVVISDKCKTINPIYGDEIETIVIGKNVNTYTSEENVIIGHTPKLKKISVNKGNKKFFITDNVLYLKSYDGIGIVKYPSAISQDEYIMPDNVVEIYDSAFDNAKIKKLSISKNLQLVTDNSFKGSEIENITFRGMCNYDVESGLFAKSVVYSIGHEFKYNKNSKLNTIVFEDDNAVMPTAGNLDYIPDENNRKIVERYAYDWIPEGVTICSRLNSTSHKFVLENNIAWVELK